MFAQPQPSSSAVGDADNNKPDTTSSTMRRHTSKADMLKLQLTVLSFDKLQLAYPVYVDDEEKEVEEDDYNEYINAQYDRIISAHVGVSSPYFYQTIQPSPTSSTSTSTDSPVFPPSEGYELSLSTDSKEPVAFYDHKEGTEEMGVAFHWGNAASNRKKAKYSCFIMKFGDSKYRECSNLSPHFEIQRERQRFDNEIKIDFQVCIMVHTDSNGVGSGSGGGSTPYACCHGYGQLKIGLGEFFFMQQQDPGGMIAEVSITKRRPPSFFPKLKVKPNDEFVRIARGSVLSVRIQSSGRVKDCLPRVFANCLPSNDELERKQKKKQRNESGHALQSRGDENVNNMQTSEQEQSVVERKQKRAKTSFVPGSVVSSKAKDVSSL